MAELWFGVLAMTLIAFSVLDGFDFGAGALTLVLGKTDAERRAVIAAIGFEGSPPPAGSASAIGSTNISTRPPRMANWSIANWVAGESPFGWTITSTSTSLSMLVASMLTGFTSKNCSACWYTTGGSRGPSCCIVGGMAPIGMLDIQPTTLFFGFESW